MKNLISLLLLGLAVQQSADAKINELGVYLKGGMLFAKGDNFNAQGVEQFTAFNNTFTPAIGVQYFHYTRQHIILFGGIEGGYEHYKAEIAKPTPQFGQTTGSPAIPYYIDRKIYYAAVQVGVGYKLANMGRLQPEIRVGQVLHMGMNATDENSANYEVTGYGNNNLIFFKKGNFGSSGSIPSAEWLNNLYIGADVLHFDKTISALSVGILLQKGLFIQDKYDNYLDITYYDANGSQVSRELFTGSHSSISLVATVKLGKAARSASKPVDE